MNASVTGSALNQIPLVNSTQILTASAQAPMVSVVPTNPVLTSTPVVASSVVPVAQSVVTSQPVVTAPVAQSLVTSQPVVAAQPVIAAQPVVAAQPLLTTQPQTYNTGTASNFTTSAFPQVPDDDYRLGRGILDDFRPGAYKSVVGVNPTLAVTTPGVAVSTPVANLGTSNINDFL